MKWTRETWIALLAVTGIAAHLVLRFGLDASQPVTLVPLILVLALGGGPLVVELTIKLARREFGSDLLAGLSIVTSIALGEYLAGAFVVLMLSGGEALESYAVRSASSVLGALARRMPQGGHLHRDGATVDVPLDAIRVGDALVIYPHEVSPVDGTVLEGHGVMDESYLTGEPYMMSKAPGATVLSGALNGETALTIRADKLPVDSRYAKIMQVMQSSEQQRPQMRRLGDQLGAWYTPLAVAIAGAAWIATGDPVRFLAVLVVATPCPLLIAIPVAILGAISLAARRGIIIRDPTVLETIDTCRTAIFDKTGTLTYGRPKLTEVIVQPGYDEGDVLGLAAALERYSKHPLATAITDAAVARHVAPREASEIREPPGQGLAGRVGERQVTITGRKALAALAPQDVAKLPSQASGLECLVLVDGRLAATLRFRDEPRSEGASFIAHLGPKHHFDRLLLVSGDRASEVEYLAKQVGIHEVYASQSPEEKVDIVRRETARQRTVFLGDGINDAPALATATVGLAFGQQSDVTSEAAGAVILESSLERVDEFLHIAHRLRRIALESAVGGMALSLAGMMIAAVGYLPPVAGAVTQEVIDVLAVLNALRMSLPPKTLSDF